jgi:hypothetical protein
MAAEAVLQPLILASARVQQNPDRLGARSRAQVREVREQLIKVT